MQPDATIPTFVNGTWLYATYRLVVRRIGDNLVPVWDDSRYVAGQLAVSCTTLGTFPFWSWPWNNFLLR